MAWTTPETAVAGDVLTAAWLNQNLRDNLLELQPWTTAWTSYTPTIAQGATSDISKTLNYCKYKLVGKTCWINTRITITGTGTTANAITVSVPSGITIAGASGVLYNLGSALYYDSSAAQSYTGVASAKSTTTINFQTHNSGGNDVGIAPNIPAGNGDVILFSVCFETT